MSEAPVTDLSLARLVHLDAEVDRAEGDGIRARWEFGHALLSERVGKKLPAGRLGELATLTGKSRQELQARVAFAERFPDEEALSNAVRQWGSWHAIVNKALAHDSTRPSAPSTISVPDGTYSTIAADPPWQYDNTKTRAAAQGHYPTMSLEELLALPVEEWAADEAHLYLWTTNGFLREAFDVLDAWGFTYKTTLTWVKPQLGIGNYFRSSTEHILFGIRGGLKTLDSNQFNWFQAKRGRHSQKPQRFFELVETCSPGPYLEMFSRARRFGWDAWGNEV